MICKNALITRLLVRVMVALLVAGSAVGGNVSHMRVDPEKKVYAICGGTVRRNINLIQQYATEYKITVSAMVGVIISEWAEGKKLAGEEEDRQYMLYRREQNPKQPKETSEYRKGKLGSRSEKQILWQKGE
jgi:hypothetical protein